MAVFIMYSSNDYSENEKSTGGTKRFLELLYGLLQNGNTVHLFIPAKANINHFPNLIRHNISIPNNIYSRYLPKGVVLYIKNYHILKKHIFNIKYDGFFAWDVPVAIQLVLMHMPKIILMVRQDFIGCRMITFRSKFKLISKLYITVITWAEHKAIKGSQKIIVQSKNELKILLQRHPNLSTELNKKTIIVPNNVNPSWITRNQLYKKKYINNNHDNTSFSLCFIGNINKLKGLDILLHSVKTLINANYKIKLIVIGDGKELSILKNEYKMYSNIIFLGHMNNPINILLNCDLLVVPSLFDSFPNTIMEALYYEIPVVGSNRGGIPEMLRYRELIFEPCQESISEKIKEIVDNQLITTYKNLCKQRKKHFSFDWVKMIETSIN